MRRNIDMASLKTALFASLAALAATGFSACELHGKRYINDPIESINIISLQKYEDIKFKDEITSFALPVDVYDDVIPLISGVEWTSSDESIATVSGNSKTGTITPKGKVGNVIIRVSLLPADGVEFGDLKDAFKVDYRLTVVDIPTVNINAIGDIMLKPNNNPINKQISATYLPNELAAYNPNFEWSFTSGSNLAEFLSTTGPAVTLKANSVGNGKVKAKLTLLGRDFYSTETAFKIIDFDGSKEEHTSITISGAPSSIIATDISPAFSLSFTPAEAIYSTIEWIYDTTKLSLDYSNQNQLQLTAMAGSASTTPYTITAKSLINANVKASFQVAVNPVVVTVKPDAGGNWRISKGKTARYTVDVNAQNKAVNWTVSDSATVTAAASGTGNIYCDLTNKVSVKADKIVSLKAVSSVDSSASDSKNITVYPPSYTLEYNKNDANATGTMASESKTFGQPYTLTANSFVETVPSAQFSKWHTTSAGSGGTSYTDNQANVDIEPSSDGATVTLYAQWTWDTNPDLMVKFGVKTSGYQISAITKQDVTGVFNRVSAYIKTQSASSVNPSVGLGAIRLGDYVNLGSLNVSSYNGRGAITLTNTDTGNDKLKLMVVGINPYYNKNDNGTTTPHIVFHFKGIPGSNRMMNTNGPNVYSLSEIREYLTPVPGVSASGNYWAALKTAGVPEDVVWDVDRRVSNKGSGATDADVIKDKLWLPTEREMIGGSSYGTSYETATNQGRLAYYKDGNTRNKGVYYWLASPYKNDTSNWCGINISGSGVRNDNGSTAVNGCVPAFAVK
jgi:hypothetical protein